LLSAITFYTSEVMGAKAGTMYPNWHLSMAPLTKCKDDNILICIPKEELVRGSM